VNDTQRLIPILLRDVMRSRWLVAYAVFFALLTDGLLRFSGSESKAILGVGSMAIMLVPFVTLMIATTYVYSAREFLETLLAQPVRRGALFTSLYLGLAGPLAGAFVAGVGIPLAARGFGGPGARAAAATLLVSGALLATGFVAIACCIALVVEDRLRGLGAAIGVWLLLGVLYDGALLTIVATLGDRPLEKPLLALTFMNPIDLAHVLLLLRLDVAALMGYTGAAFQRFFAAGAGSALALAALVLWTVVPVAIAARRFQAKDF